MAGRRPIKGLRKVTLNLIGDSYDDIKRFSELSPSGVSANAFVREVIHRFGLFCREKLTNGQIATIRDYEDVEDFIESMLDAEKEGKNNAHV